MIKIASRVPYVDITSGIIHLNAEITYDNTVDFLAIFRQMERLPEVKSIKVHITAHGGALMPAIAIVQTMKVCTKPVITLGAGYVASAALPILAAGTPGYRRVLEGTTLLLHEPTHTFGETSRKSPSIEGWKHEVAFHEAISARYFWCLGECSQRSALDWQQRLGSKPTCLLTIDEAMTCSLIDQSITLTQNHT